MNEYHHPPKFVFLILLASAICLIFSLIAMAFSLSARSAARALQAECRREIELMHAERDQYEVEIAAKVDVVSQKVTIVSQTVKVTEQLLTLKIGEVKRFLLETIDKLTRDLLKKLAGKCYCQSR